MIKLKLKTEIKNLKGDAIKSDNDIATVGLILANTVLEPHKDKKGFRPLKAYELAKKFYDKEEVELDQSDLIQIKELIEESTYQPMVIAQVLEAIIEAEKQCLK